MSDRMTAEESATEAVAEALADLATLGDYDRDTIAESAEPPEVIYYAHGQDVISELESEYGDEAVDLVSGQTYAADDWRDAMMAWANALAYVAHGAEARKALDAAEEAIDGFRNLVAEVAEACGGEPDPDAATLSRDCPYGWAVHNRETEDGGCVWSTEPGYYNPELLEGELLAVSSPVLGGRVWVSIAWSPVDAESEEG